MGLVAGLAETDPSVTVALFTVTVAAADELPLTLPLEETNVAVTLCVELAPTVLYV
jgi:hypothetical protein